jgi:hypothetical protein
VETAFNIFDVTGDGEVEAKVCCLHFAAQNMEICQNFAAQAQDKNNLKNSKFTSRIFGYTYYDDVTVKFSSSAFSLHDYSISPSPLSSYFYHQTYNSLTKAHSQFLSSTVYLPSALFYIRIVILNVNLKPAN